MDNPKVVVIILNWNGLADTLECLKSLKNVTYPNFRVIVADNNSFGNDVGIIREQFKSFINIIPYEKNYGYAVGNNIAIRRALNECNPEYIIVLNNDTVVAPGFITGLVGLAETDANIGIVGPKTYILGSKNTFQFTTVKMSLWTSWPFFMGLGKVDKGQYDKVKDTDYCQGSCILIRKEVIEKIGLLDPGFFVYWEETDYCFRAKNAGYRIVYCPQSVIWHRDWSRIKDEHFRNRVSSMSVYYLYKNRFSFLKKNANSWQKIISSLCYFFIMLWYLAGIYLFYYRSTKGLRYLFKGSADGFIQMIRGSHN